jgi:hypothetical protein
MHEVLSRACLAWWGYPARPSRAPPPPAGILPAWSAGIPCHLILIWNYGQSHSGCRHLNPFSAWVLSFFYQLIPSSSPISLLYPLPMSFVPFLIFPPSLHFLCSLHLSHNAPLVLAGVETKMCFSHFREISVLMQMFIKDRPNISIVAKIIAKITRFFLFSRKFCENNWFFLQKISNFFELPHAFSSLLHIVSRKIWAKQIFLRKFLQKPIFRNFFIESLPESHVIKIFPQKMVPLCHMLPTSFVLSKKRKFSPRFSQVSHVFTNKFSRKRFSRQCENANFLQP